MGGGMEGVLRCPRRWYDCGGRNDRCHQLRACVVCEGCVRGSMYGV